MLGEILIFQIVLMMFVKIFCLLLMNFSDDIYNKNIMINVIKTTKNQNAVSYSEVIIIHTLNEENRLIYTLTKKMNT